MSNFAKALRNGATVGVQRRHAHSVRSELKEAGWECQTMNQNDEFAGFSAPESRKTECPKLLVPVGEEELHRVAVSMMVRINQLETERKGLLAELGLLRQGGEVVRKLLLEAYDEGGTPDMPIHYRMTQGLNQIMGAGADLVEFIKFIQAETEHVEVEDDEIPF